MAVRRPSRLYLSPPSASASDRAAVLSALDSGWIAPLGPDVEALESALMALTRRRHAVALVSGTSALHLGLLALGVGPGANVLVPTLTFAASAFAVAYTGASPAFVDVEERSWGVDPELLHDVLRRRASAGRLPAAIITVDLFGRTCDYDTILPICAEYDVPVLADAAEAVGATHGATPAGGLGHASVLSFNGNKMVTTSGGGALLTDDSRIAEAVRHRATQSRLPAPWYEHDEIGFNYRLSNLLAALGRSQLARLPELVARRRQIRDRYASGLADLPGVSVGGDPPWGRSNAWLTTVRFSGDLHPGAPERVRLALEEANIESRPVWKPMHQQPVFAQAESHLRGVADRIFAEGLCLPSGSGMSDEDVDVVVGIVRETISE